METNRDVRFQMYKIAWRLSLTSYSSDVIYYLTEEDINIMSHSPYFPYLILHNLWINNSIEWSLTNWINEMWCAHTVSKVAKMFLEKEFKKTFNELLERIQLAINNHNNYCQYLIKSN